jgi:hypothetical protein
VAFRQALSDMPEVSFESVSLSPRVFAIDGLLPRTLVDRLIELVRRVMMRCHAVA